MLLRFFICFAFIISLELSAQDFDRVSKALAFLEFDGGNNGLGAITEKEARLYVITTQSLFVKYGFNFVLKDLKGNRLNCIAMSISPDSDLIRFEIETNAFLQPIKLGGDPTSILKINPKNGTVLMKAYTEEEITEPGCVVVSEYGSIAGFGSWNDGFAGKKVAFVEVSDNTKWEKNSIRSFGTQIDNLLDMKAKVSSIEALKRVCKMNAYIEYLPVYHESHVPWIKQRNEQYEVAVFDSKGGKSSAAAKFKHESRCSIYTSMKRLSSYANNISSIDRISKWESKYFKELSNSLAGRADEINKNLKKEMTSLVKSYPATKAKK